MTWPLTIHVPGPAAPQGSKRAFVCGGRAVLVESSKRCKPWRALVASYARECMGSLPPTECYVAVDVWYVFERPKSHLCKSGLRSNAPAYPARPDVDKLVRATLDALTGVVYRDDAQVVEESARKVYGPESSTSIIVTILRGPP